MQAPSTDGPLGAGRAFLNPVFPEDVKVMQVRLKELGYYKGKIDQNFGPLTKQALDNFAVKYGFPKGQWSLGVQKGPVQRNRTVITPYKGGPDNRTAFVYFPSKTKQQT